MDPITTALAKKAGDEAVDVLKKESESFLSAALGEPAKALGGLITDHINARRHRNLISITVTAKQLLSSAGVSPKEVPLNIIHPSLEIASLAEDAGLQSAWANLLANSADPRQLSVVLPAFPAMLKDLTARDAKFLSAVHAKTEELPVSRPVKDLTGAKAKEFEALRPATGSTFDKQELLNIYCGAGLSQNADLAKLYYYSKEQSAEILADIKDFDITLDSVMRLGIMQQITEGEPIHLGDYVDNRKRNPFEKPIPVYVGTSFEFTALGAAFVAACSAPKGVTLAINK